jgi:hypothetical protein
MRDNIWLSGRLNEIWEVFFSDVTKLNEIKVRFLGRWKNKFGHIKKLKDGSSEIVINGLFKDEKIPDYIVDLTIAHEIVHYMHGFNSPHERKFRYPHQGGVVRKELLARGFKIPLKIERRFLKQDWRTICKELL